MIQDAQHRNQKPLPERKEMGGFLEVVVMKSNSMLRKVISLGRIDENISSSLVLYPSGSVTVALSYSKYQFLGKYYTKRFKVWKMECWNT